jgi:hypothetical protein
MANVSYITVGGRLNLSRGRIRIYVNHQQEGCIFKGMMVAIFVISKINLQILRAAPLVTHFLSSLFDLAPYKHPVLCRGVHNER